MNNKPGQHDRVATLDHQIMQIPMQVDADPEVMKRFRLVLKLLVTPESTY